MFCVEPSGFAFDCFADMALDCRETSGGGTEVGLLNSALDASPTACRPAMVGLVFCIAPVSLSAASA